MNYIHAENSIVIEYPYSIEKMRSDNPQTSFPIEMSAEELAEWGVFAVEEQVPPDFNKQTEFLEIGDPTQVDGKWVSGWNVIQASPEEVDRQTFAQASIIRLERDRMLCRTDFTQLADYSCSIDDQISLKKYRQALRDVPQQSGFPWSVTWPKLTDEESS